MAALLVSGCSWSSSPAPKPLVAAPGDQVLPLAAEKTSAHYDRAEWKHWTVGPDGCDTREKVLKRDGKGVVTGKGCRVLKGTWFSPYDDAEQAHPITDAAGLQIDHVVPLHEAAQSGGENWSADRKREFANDLDELLAVPGALNEEKGDGDPAEWLPPEPDDVCPYLVIWVKVKRKYGLTADQPELDALTEAGCHYR